MAERKISQEGEVVMSAMERHIENLEKHDCTECYGSYSVFLKAVGNWLGVFDKEQKEVADIFGIKKKRKENGDGG